MIGRVCLINTHMSTITIQCTECSNFFEKPKKEYTRRVKGGASRFYCSLRCAKIWGNKNNPPSRDYARSKANIDHLRKVGRVGSSKITKYTAEERPFREYCRRVEQRKKQSDRSDENIDIPYLMEIWERQQGRCALSNIPLKHKDEAKSQNTKASLDRIDSSKGYTKGNVQFVSCTINYAKSSQPDSTILELFTLLSEYYYGDN